ncbi:hypothetical protein N656DRAFT_797201 [Canariomyces notabilis]|uniref:Uncharacterized protein n=1 Tax=Canariomyces notabilis TaxID=2074819 RepID=A0AAN6YTG0_9PEZI|nr:hypothetical protein N656DRAFT_797201 [Canariomyces arenarius]
MDRGIENEFARLESVFAGKREKIHSQQANISLKRFLKKYLGIEEEWSAPAPDSRPSATVTLSWYYLDDRELPNQIMAKVPGLHLEKFGYNHVIGWDAAHVTEEITRLEEERRRLEEQEEAEKRAAEEEKKAQKKARWERRCKRHYELVRVAKTQESHRPLGLQTLPGAYLVRWDDNSEDAERCNDPHHDIDVMKLNIFPAESSHGCKAYFNFGLIEGTMLLAMTKRGVEMLRDKQPKHSEWSDPEVSDDDVHDGDCKTGEAKTQTKLTGEKRSLGDIADPWGVQAARANRQQLTGLKKAEEESHPNRVYFQFVCNEINGYPLVDDDNEHVGYLDFDETGLAAKGNFDVPRLGMKEQAIAIFKIAEKPASDKKPLPWYEFDGRTWGSTW